jgi:hypothetical protein
VPRNGSALLAVLATLCWSAAARAESARWLSLDGRCKARVEEIGRRVEAALAGSRPTTARAKLSIDETEGGLALTINLEVDSRALGTKTVVVPSCEEALDAAVLVLAVALGEASPPSTDASVSVAAPEQESLNFVSPKPVVEDVDPPKAAGRQAKRPAAGVVLLGGVDGGVLPNATPYVGAAVSLLALPIELRAAFRYGLRRQDESVETDSIVRTSADFAALELSACPGLGEKLRVSLCAGGELGLVRVESTQGDGVRTVDRDEDAPRLAGLLTGLVSRSVGAVRLELELAGSAVAVGPEGAARAGLRVGAGAGTRF